METIIFLSDFFVEDILGGAELSTEVVIEDLTKRGYKIKKVRCIDFNNSLLNKKLVITNFASLSEYHKQLISINSNYIIIERDQKFVRSRNLTSYKNFIAPNSEIVNREFYRNAKSVLCLTSKHTELTRINLGLSNIIDIGSTHFSERQIKMIESNITDSNNGRYAIVDGKKSDIAIKFCQKNNIDYDLIPRQDYPDLMKTLSNYIGLVFFSHHFESFCRLLVEAKILGLKIITDNRSGCTYEPWFNKYNGLGLSNIVRKNVERSINIVADEILKLSDDTIKKVLFIGGFDPGSTNISQLEALQKLGYDVHGYNYRDSLSNVNAILQSITGFDVLLIAKGNNISDETIRKFKLNNRANVIYWFPDAMCNYTSEMRSRAKVCDAAFFDKKNVLESEISDTNNWVCEGFDSLVDIVRPRERDIPVSFIGDIKNWPHRQKMLKDIDSLRVFDNVYGTDHAIMVARSMININVCTDDSASDRVYKVLAAGGFLLTDDWYGRELTGLEDGKDLVIYKDSRDLQKKIKYYLKNPKKCDEIRKNGNIKVQKLNRLNWAKKVAQKF